MRLRRLCATATAAAAVTLAGCRTNVGVAATIDGHRVSESTVGSYVTPKSQPVRISAADGSAQSVDPKPFVVNILIRHRLFLKLLEKTPAGAPSVGQISSLVARYTKGSSIPAVVAKLGAPGYSTKFDRILIEVQQFAAVLNTEVQRGVNVNTIAAKLKFPVSVNPRYGKWDRRSFNLDTTPGAGVPGFVTLQPTPTLVPPAGASTTSSPGN